MIIYDEDLVFLSFFPHHEDVVYESTPNEGLEGSLRSRGLEVVGERPFFLVPTTSKATRRGPCRLRIVQICP